MQAWGTFNLWIWIQKTDGELTLKQGLLSDRQRLQTERLPCLTHWRLGSLAKFLEHRRQHGRSKASGALAERGATPWRAGGAFMLKVKRTWRELEENLKGTWKRLGECEKQSGRRRSWGAGMMLMGRRGGELRAKGEIFILLQPGWWLRFRRPRFAELATKHQRSDSRTSEEIGLTYRMLGDDGILGRRQVRKMWFTNQRKDQIDCDHGELRSSRWATITRRWLKERWRGWVTNKEMVDEPSGLWGNEGRSNIGFIGRWRKQG